MANKSKPRKLGLSIVKDDAKKINEIVEIDFNEYDGAHFQVRLSPFFSNQGKENVIETLREYVKAMEDKEIVFPDKQLPNLLVFLSVLEFSDFPRPKTDDIKKKIAYFYQAIETKYFREVSEHLIDSEISEIWSMVLKQVEINEKLQSTINQNQALLKSIQEKNGLNGTKTDAE